MMCIHGVESKSVDSRWNVVNQKISATPEDDHDDQWDSVWACICCAGPSRWEFTQQQSEPGPKCSYCSA
jgi:hypothetical protein